MSLILGVSGALFRLLNHPPLVVDQLLLSMGAALHLACYNGNLGLVDSLLARGCDVCSTNHKFRMTPLTRMSSRDSLEGGHGPVWLSETRGAELRLNGRESVVISTWWKSSWIRTIQILHHAAVAKKRSSHQLPRLLI